MTVASFHRLSLTTTLLLAIVGCAGGSPFLLASGGALAAILVLFRPGGTGKNVALGSKALVHGTTVLGLFAAIALFRTARIDSVVTIVFLGIFNRYLLRQGHRDDLILIGASAVLVAVATTITPGIGFLPLILAYISFALFGLWSALLLSLDPKRMGARALPQGRRTIAVVGTSLTLVLTLVLSLFPRHQFVRFFGAGYFSRLPGAAPQMRLSNDGAETEGDRTVVFRATPLDSSISKFRLRDLYARMYVLEEFDGTQWRSDLAEKLVPRLAPQRNQQSDGLSQALPLKVTLERRVERRYKHPLIALGRTFAWRTPYQRLRYTPGGSWVLGGSFRGQRITYDVEMDEAMPAFKRTDHLRRDFTYTELPPEIDERIRALAAELGKDRSREELVNAVLLHFRRGFSYSLTGLRGEEADPLVRFLFEAKAGHCELYAGAVALLLRLNGVPARVATGYYGGWWNELGGYLEFTEEDAHSWVETQRDDGRWIWVDATPPQLRARQGKKRWSWLRDAYDAVQAFWFDHVIDFDEQKRKSMIGDLKAGFLPEGWGDGHDASAPAGEEASRRTKIGWGLPLIAIATLLLVWAVWTWRKRRRLDLEVLGRRIQHALGGKGATQPLGVLIASAPDAVKGRAEQMVFRYETLRFGQADASIEDVLALREDVAAFEDAAADAREASY